MSFSKRLITKRALWIVLIWLLTAIFFFFQEHWSILYGKPRSEDYNIWGRFLNYFFVSSSAAIIGGLYTVNIMESWLNKFPFWKSALFILFKFILIGTTISVIGSIILTITETRLSPLSSELWTATFELIQSWLFIKTFFLWFFIIIITLIIMKIRNLDS